MKKIKFIFCAILLVVFFGRCTETESACNEVSSNRIKLINTRIINGYRYSILSVDSVEYLTRDSGGFIRLEK